MWHLQYLQRNEIDTRKWDQCINTATNGLVYACSFYLDHMAKHWDALVWGNYEAVMPLTWNKKWGIKYLYQPPFTQQLGIFTDVPLTQDVAASFLSVLPTHFRFAEIFLNHAHPKADLPQRSNYILPLHATYNQLQAQYKHDLLKNLKRASRFNLSYSNDVDYNVILEAYKKFYGSRTPHVTDIDYARFARLCSFVRQKDLVLRAVTENNQLLSAAILLRHRNRLYLLASVTWPEGRAREANHFLLDRLINEFAASDMVLDFEGSDLPGVAHFYRNFGSTDQPYFFYRYNRLPWLIRWVKSSA